MGDGISIFNTEGDYKAKLAYRIKDESGEKGKSEIQYLRWKSKPVFKMEWGSITIVYQLLFKMKNIKGVIILLVMVPIFWWILKMLMISRIDKMKFLMFYIA